MIRVTVWVLLLAMSGGVIADEPPSLAAFSDGISHWKNGHDTTGYPAYLPEQFREIADNLLLYQRDNGGWPPNFDPTRILDDADRADLAAQRFKLDTSFDNRATYPEIEYLAAVFARTRNDRYRVAAIRGLEFVLAAQTPTGGWPHSYPEIKGYRPRITIVDDVMPGVLGTLSRVVRERHYDLILSTDLRDRVSKALQRGNACLLALQIKVDGRPLGWASQYDEVTLEPTQGRSFELPALVSSETASVLRYLMSIDSPSAEVCAAIEAGIAWLESVKLHGLRVQRVPAEPVRYEHHTSRDDVVVVADPAAGPIWSRFYEVETNRPFMANRDGRKVYQLSDVERERRTGYAWYTMGPARLLDRDYPDWKARQAAGR